MNPDRISGARFLFLYLGTFFLAACADSSILSGKLCDREGRCLPGYVCDPATNRCVPEDQPTDGGEPGGDQSQNDGGAGDIGG